jgi:hypothetical protein
MDAVILFFALMSGIGFIFMFIYAAFELVWWLDDIKQDVISRRPYDEYMKE